MAFRPIPMGQAFTFYGLSGQLLPGGSVQFMEAGTTTPKDVYGERALSTNNGSTIGLDASGRLEHDVWASGDVRYRVYDVDDVEQADVDDVIDPTAAGLSLPSGDAGQFLTTDGAGNYSFADVREVPDPTGSANKFLKTDGTALSWAAGPADATSDIAAATGSFEAGDGTDTFMLLSGADSASATGTASTNKAVVFSTAFSATPRVVVVPTSASQPGGPTVTELTAVSTTGFTVNFDVAEGSVSGATMVNAVPFNWIAVGLKP